MSLGLWSCLIHGCELIILEYEGILIFWSSHHLGGWEWYFELESTSHSERRLFVVPVPSIPQHLYLQQLLFQKNNFTTIFGFLFSFLEWGRDTLHLLPAVFELLYHWQVSPTRSPCTLHLCTNAIFLVSPWLCLPASHLPLGKLSAVSEITQSAWCPNSKECLPHSQLKGIRLRKTSPMAT